jgi:5'-nucleotidase
VAGLRYVWDPSKPIGSRVWRVEVNEGNVWQPISPTQIYRVVSNDFMRRGGDGYTVFLQALNPYDFGPALDQAAMDYLMSFPNDTYTPFLDGRITTVKKVLLPIVLK